jgi:hypothetical protein
MLECNFAGCVANSAQLADLPVIGEQVDHALRRVVVEEQRDHDDRVDFLAGIDLILRGIDSARPC